MPCAPKFESNPDCCDNLFGIRYATIGPDGALSDNRYDVKPTRFFNSDRKKQKTEETS